jgi:hypothetical protein
MKLIIMASISLAFAGLTVYLVWSGVRGIALSTTFFEIVRACIVCFLKIIAGLASLAISASFAKEADK